MLIRLSNPTADFIGAEELRVACRAPDDGEDDERLASILKGEMRRYEDFTGRFLLPTGLEARFAGWHEPLQLRAVPIREVTEVVYLDEDHQEQVLNSSAWYQVEGTCGWSIWFSPDATLPDHSDRMHPVRVRFEAGYEAADDVATGTAAELEPVDADKINVLRMVRRIYDRDEQIAIEEMRQAMGNRRVLL